MHTVNVFKPGGYRYLKAGFQFSSGVAAEQGFEIERARLARPLPIAAGFDEGIDEFKELIREAVAKAT